jgi:molybdopterin-binding protein
MACGCPPAGTGNIQERTMKLSARNQIKGQITEVKKGATTSHVQIDVGGGVVITASITNEAVEALGLKAGIEAFAVIKASDVMVGVSH